MAVDTAKTLLSTAATLTATVTLARAISNDLFPDGLSLCSAISSRFSTTLTVVIDEYKGIATNQMYRAVETYLGGGGGGCSCAATASTTARRVRVYKPEEEPALEVSLDQNEELVDVFRGVTFRWVLKCRKTDAAVSRLHIEVRHYELRFHRRHRAMALGEYLAHVMEEAEVIRAKKKGLKIHTGKYAGISCGDMDVWSAVPFDHPTTFRTLAIDPDQKREIVEDLDQFVARKEYYRRVGRAWKRGYLLYGPPGTGKSSLVAAMANHLRYDIYDLELTQVDSNSSLRTLLLATTTKSIIVIEDIDCSVPLINREDTASNSNTNTCVKDAADNVTLSGLLNLIDGLWSCCGEERIIVFTTNYKERLDPALLRPGRMDVHVHLSCCMPPAFRSLIDNYFPNEACVDYPMLPEVEALMLEVNVTLAEVAEEMMRRGQLEAALRGLITLMNERKKAKQQVLESNGSG